MNELYRRELETAQQHIRDAGLDADDFTFNMSYQEPDPDGGGMFTVRYDVVVTRRSTGKAFSSVGGIGLRWVDAFDHQLKAGHFG